MRAVRERAGLSLREAAARAGVDKNTIMRVEAGLPVRETSRVRLCAGYGVFAIHPRDLSARLKGPGYAVHLPDGASWHRARLPDPHEPSQVSTSEAMRAPEERLRQGRLGLATQFFSFLGCDRADGGIRSAVLEVYGPSGHSRQQSGEAFVYVLSGELRFEVDEESFVLKEGMAATFDRTLPHMHEPAPGFPLDKLPARMLYVQID